MGAGQFGMTTGGGGNGEINHYVGLEQLGGFAAGDGAQRLKPAEGANILTCHRAVRFDGGNKLIASRR